uniref:Uncharacterized protein n=1 Tax=Phytophthora ramorum TaxID=164328 RepID=H3H596_PHYRM
MAISSGSTPLFTPIVPPEIKSISHEALTLWKKERREYEAKLRARCRVSGEVYEAVVLPIIESFDPDLLDTFCELRLNLASVDVTEGMLIAEISNIISNVKNDTLPDIKALFRSQLRMNMTESDVDARVLDYFNHFGIIMRENGLMNCFEGSDGTREKCKRLAASLHPATLKSEVKQCLRYTHKPAASNPRLLFELIVDKAKEHERQFQRTRKRDTTSGRDNDTQKTSKPKDKKRAWTNKRAMATVAENKSKTGAPTAQADHRPQSISSRPPPSPCPKCKEMHWLRECTKATEKEKAELRERMREAFAAKKARIKRLGELLPDTERLVTLNGALELPYCADSGSDHTVIGRSHWEQLQALDPSVQPEELDIPVRNQTFGSVQVTADKKARLHLLIHTAAGPVEPMNAVDVLIVDVDDDEFIIGNDLLMTLGIDVDRQLEQLADRGDDETCGDPIELEADDPPVSTATQPSDDDIFTAVECLIARAVENGFPADKVEQLRTIAHAYDVWRLELRADPPAKVPPLEVRLQDGARPTKFVGRAPSFR